MSRTRFSLLKKAPAVLAGVAILTASAWADTIEDLTVERSLTVHGPMLLRKKAPLSGPDYYTHLNISKDTIRFGEVIPAPRNQMVLTKKSLSFTNSQYGTNAMYISQDKISLVYRIPNPSPRTILEQGTAFFSNGYSNKTTIDYNRIVSATTNGNSTIDGPTITVSDSTAGTTTIAGGNISAVKLTAPTVASNTISSTNVNSTRVTASNSITSPHAQITNLDVNQNVRASKINTQELYVVPNVWADYVFRPDYKLSSLDDLDGYIKENGKLPGIPSESEVLENGVSVGEMQVKLLEKVEEMTLHMIKMQKRIAELEGQLQAAK